MTRKQFLAATFGAIFGGVAAVVAATTPKPETLVSLPLMPFRFTKIQNIRAIPEFAGQVFTEGDPVYLNGKELRVHYHATDLIGLHDGVNAPFFMKIG